MGEKMENNNMKMVMVVVPKSCGEGLLSSLVNAGYSATYHETRGGMLRQSQLSVFIAVNETEVPKVLTVINCSCKGGGKVHQGFGLGVLEPLETSKEDDLEESRSAVIFIWSLDRFELP